jgi:capsular exopolysaccharide synthesis family protein
MARRLDEWQLEDYLRALSMHRWAIVAAVLAFAGHTAMSVSRQPNIYRATARILIETQSPQVVQFQEVSRTNPFDRTFLQTEYLVISSRAVMSRVIEELHLDSFPPFAGSKDPVALLQGRVSVEPVRGTKLVDVSSAGHKPDLVARIANTVAEQYARLNLERRRDLTAGGAEWLREEVQKIEQKMRESQLKLLDFQEQHGTISAGEENQNSALQQLQGLNASLNKTREERMDAEVKYREKHPVLLELLAKERELQLALFEQEQKAMEMNRFSVQYNTLLREAKTSESIYNILLTRLKELTVQEGIQSNNVVIVDYARVPSSPIGPARTKRTTTMALLGLLVGCGIAFSLEFFANTVRNRQEFEHLLEIPFLGHVPIVPFANRRGGLLLLRDPKHRAAEAISSIRTTLEFILPAGEPCALLLTSAVPEEGKSTVCANLALALHELGRKVLLVDADLRRPSLHRYLGVSLEPGLSGYLQDTVSEQELIQSVPTMEGFQVVTAGLTPAQPTDLLTGSKFRELLLNWQKQYQYVLMDSPPVLVAADAAALATSVFGVIYIVRANRTHSEVAHAGRQRLLDVGAKLIGGILNGSRLELERGYRYYYSYRYYRDEKKRTARKSPSPIPDEPIEESISG